MYGCVRRGIISVDQQKKLVWLAAKPISFVDQPK